ncbi:MAG: Nif11-like leader peptide family natural product precursor [Spirochaetia bacterium]|nr:Nif11-like leader peptide family natural product precursor [Spirochaetia bacterium]
MPIDRAKLPKVMMIKAAQCETADELIELAKTDGFEITKAEAEAYLSELDNMELDAADLDKVAGGGCYMVKHCPQNLI